MSFENVPSLRNVEVSLENELAEIANTKQEIQNSPRYDDMPSEKEYQLQQLEEQREATLQSHEERFQQELNNLESRVADEMFNMPAVPSSTMASVNSFVDNVKQQLQVSNNVADTLHLLSVKADGLNDVERQALHLQMDDLKSVVQSKQMTDGEKATAEKILGKIEETAGDTKRGRKLSEMQAQLKEIKDNGATLRRAYDVKETVLDRYRKQLQQEHVDGQATDPSVYRNLKEKNEEG